MSTWEQSELAITQTLDRIEKSIDKLSIKVDGVQEYVSEQKGKTSVTALWVSSLVAGAVTTAFKFIWHK